MIAQFKKITLAVAIGATALAVSAPAEAQRYGGYRGRDNGGAAIVAGVAGLAVGAALASNIRRDDGYYYDRGYEGPVVAYQPVYEGYYDSYPGYDYYGGYGYRGYNGYQGYYDGRRGGYDRGRGGYGYRGGRGGDHGGRGGDRGGYRR